MSHLQQQQSSAGHVSSAYHHHHNHHVAVPDQHHGGIIAAADASQQLTSCCGLTMTLDQFQRHRQHGHPIQRSQSDPMLSDPMLSMPRSAYPFSPTDYLPSQLYQQHQQQQQQQQQQGKQQHHPGHHGIQYDGGQYASGYSSPHALAAGGGNGDYAHSPGGSGPGSFTGSGSFNNLPSLMTDHLFQSSPTGTGLPSLPTPVFNNFEDILGAHYQQHRMQQQQQRQRHMLSLQKQQQQQSQQQPQQRVIATSHQTHQSAGHSPGDPSADQRHQLHSLPTPPFTASTSGGDAYHHRIPPPLAYPRSPTEAMLLQQQNQNQNQPHHHQSQHPHPHHQQQHSHQYDHPAHHSDPGYGEDDQVDQGGYPMQSSRLHELPPLHNRHLDLPGTRHNPEGAAPPPNTVVSSPYLDYALASGTVTPSSTWSSPAPSLPASPRQRHYNLTTTPQGFPSSASSSPRPTHARSASSPATASSHLTGVGAGTGRSSKNSSGNNSGSNTPPMTGRVYRCFVPDCAKQYGTGAGLRYHLRNFHKMTTIPRQPPQRPPSRKPDHYSCPKCAKQYSTAAGLRYHKKTFTHAEDVAAKIEASASAEEEEAKRETLAGHGKIEEDEEDNDRMMMMMEDEDDGDDRMSVDEGREDEMRELGHAMGQMKQDSDAGIPDFFAAGRQSDDGQFYETTDWAQ
ncbi:hypothetical protein HDU87_008101 [Geranomyces variabilis]|uniref:C2H2-type domain-containing protein n=1 Tax=Geranomyces variabilis TaxID=109894 RepID=A0AAD5TRG3_9FUNG|nr:hypothetical protein HDU87_008101 [Geranomyces variabilis]